MSKVNKIVGILVAGLLVANCSATYKMKSEKGKVLKVGEFRARILV